MADLEDPQQTAGGAGEVQSTVEDMELPHRGHVWLWSSTDNVPPAGM